ncbi:AraC family transcriptional regulator ligand-binding domain-containing protein [Streptosporangium sp. NPDC051023]|uniref:AraC family transcriptional regulator ligand-binding domain-containing protein n=1 Tax=Streptosporangium sp. NPDC051023 TaxID=3155410 RepID=UPI00344FC74F
MNEGSNSVGMARMLLRALSHAGMDPSRFAHLPDLQPDVLVDDLARPSTPTLASMWEQLITHDLGTAIGVNAASLAPLGTYGVWDYLFTSGGNLIESATRALDYVELVGDPTTEWSETVEDGRLFVIRHHTGFAAPDVVQAIEIFAQVLWLRRAREATGRPIVPIRVTFRHRPPREHAHLVEAFGTRNIDYEADANSLIVLDDDARAPLPMSQPGIEHVLVRHANQVLASSRPILDWPGMFRLALDTVLAEDGAPTLERVAQRLAISPRTLQRRLGENGTSWREEIESVRQAQALKLIRGTDLPMQAIAARLGYSDVRAMRRAVHRWHGHPPHTLRAQPSAIGGARTSSASGMPGSG